MAQSNQHTGHSTTYHNVENTYKYDTVTLPKKKMQYNKQNCTYSYFFYSIWAILHYLAGPIQNYIHNLEPDTGLKSVIFQWYKFIYTSVLFLIFDCHIRFITWRVGQHTIYQGSPNMRPSVLCYAPKMLGCFTYISQYKY